MWQFIVINILSHLVQPCLQLQDTMSWCVCLFAYVAALRVLWATIIMLWMWGDGGSLCTWWHEALGRFSCWRRDLFICTHHPGSPHKILMHLRCRSTNLPQKSLLQPPLSWGCAYTPVFETVLLILEGVCVCVWCVWDWDNTCSPIACDSSICEQGIEAEIRPLP